MSDINRHARHVVAACYLGWTLDAFDFFIMVFVFSDIAAAFGSSLTAATWAVTVTLAMRAVGAFGFGRLADRFGRRPILMASVLSYSVFELASGFAPNLASFLVLRAMFGVAMGGEWGIGASLTMETIPASWRGTVSGLLQAGYPSGYLLATLLYWLAYPVVGWRGMFILGALPALLVLYIRRSVPESPEWETRRAAPKAPHPGFFATIGRAAPLTIYAVLMMMGFNFFSHGTQDLYPNAFLKGQSGFNHNTVAAIAIVYNIGAILGGLTMGTLSQKIGRRASIVLGCLGAALSIYPWVFGSTPYVIGFGAFCMQFFVQGAWGVVPAHLNELSPAEIRATFPGVVYQLGNFLASANATIQSGFADQLGHDYRLPLAVTVGVVVVVLTVFMVFGPEAQSERLGERRPEEERIAFFPMLGALCVIVGLAVFASAFLPSLAARLPEAEYRMVGLFGGVSFISGVVLISAGSIVSALQKRL